MDSEHVEALLEAYALDALDPLEAAAVEAHLETCGACSRLHRQLRQATSLLPEALVARSVRAPASLKSGVLAAIARAESTTSRRRLSRPYFKLPQLAAGVAVLALLALTLTWGFQQRSALARERTVRGQLETVVEQRELIFEIVDSNRTSKAFLRATQPGSTSYGKLYTRPDMANVVVLVGRMPAQSAGQVFNVWVTADGKAQLAGRVKVDDQGFGLLVFDSGVNGPRYDTVVVLQQAEEATVPGAEAIIRWEAPR